MIRAGVLVGVLWSVVFLLMSNVALPGALLGITTLPPMFATCSAGSQFNVCSSHITEVNYGPGETWLVQFKCTKGHVSWGCIECKSTLQTQSSVRSHRCGFHRRTASAEPKRQKRGGDPGGERNTRFEEIVGYSDDMEVGGDLEDTFFETKEVEAIRIAPIAAIARIAVIAPPVPQQEAATPTQQRVTMPPHREASQIFFRTVEKQGLGQAREDLVSRAIYGSFQTVSPKMAQLHAMLAELQEGMGPTQRKLLAKVLDLIVSLERTYAVEKQKWERGGKRGDAPRDPCVPRSSQDLRRTYAEGLNALIPNLAHPHVEEVSPNHASVHLSEVLNDLYGHKIPMDRVRHQVDVNDPRVPIEVCIL